MLSGITATVTASNFSNNLQPNAQGSALLVVALTTFTANGSTFNDNSGAYFQKCKRVCELPGSCKEPSHSSVASGAVNGALVVQQTAAASIFDNTFSNNQGLPIVHDGTVPALYLLYF